VKLVSYDAEASEVAGVKSGETYAIIAQKPYDIGFIGVTKAVASLKGQTVPKEIKTGVVVATKSNINSPAVKKYLYHGC
jgi:ribose transport system substrate-binding protein